MNESRLRRSQIEAKENSDNRDSKAQILAAEMVATATKQRGHKIHFSIMPRRHEPVPFPVHWKHKNSSGVSFAKADTAEAKAWIVTALLAGYGVCLHWGNRKSGGGVYALAEKGTP